jgi:hypothetical protein
MPSRPVAADRSSGETSTVVRLLTLVFFASLVLALAVAAYGGTAAAPPAVVNVQRTTSGVAITFAGYDQGSYTVEISRRPNTRSDHHFSSPVNRSPALPIGPSGTATWYLTRTLAHGDYYVRVFDDYSAVALEAATKLCESLGCRPTFDPTHAYVSWSAVAHYRL